MYGNEYIATYRYQQPTLTPKYNHQQTMPNQPLPSTAQEGDSGRRLQGGWRRRNCGMDKSQTSACVLFPRSTALLGGPFFRHNVTRPRIISCSTICPCRPTQSLRQTTTRGCLPFSWIILLLWTSWLGTVQGQANLYYGQCFRHLFTADGDQNGFLTQTEYSDAIQRITYGAINAPFTSLTPSLLTAFATRTQGGSGIVIQGAGPGVTPTSEQRIALGDLCEAIMVGVLNELGVTVDFSMCFMYLSIGDQNRNGILERQEFPRYAHPLSGNLYVGVTQMERLPIPVQLVFDDFANIAIGAIDVTGAKPGTQRTPETERLLQSLCRQTLVAVAAGQNIATVAPTSPPKQFEPSFRFCTTAMAAGDLGQDSLMDSSDYARFINTLSGNKFPLRLFDPLPNVIKENFIRNADELGNWNIQGARPGNPRTPEQEQRLKAYCDSTANALNEQANAPPPAPTLAPTRGPPEPIPYVRCTLSMATSDKDRSNTLSPAEYVDFLNKVQTFAWRDLTYEDLQTPLKRNYEQLAAASSSEGIDVKGSFPGTQPTPEEKTFLEKVCSDTAFAIEDALYPKPTPAPTAAPTLSPDSSATRAPTLSGNLTVFSAFIISTVSNGTIDDDLSGNSTVNRDALEIAYGSLVGTIVTDFLATKRDRDRNLRGLALNGLVDDSAKLYLFEDADCPEQSERTDCKKVYGSFDVDVRDEPNPNLLQGQLVSAVQRAINQTDGGLQSILDQIRPDSPIVVVGVPEDNNVFPPTQAPVASPTPAPALPSPRSPNDDDDGLSLWLLIVIIVAGLLLCCCCVFFAFRSGVFSRKRKEKPKASFDLGGDDTLPAPSGSHGDDDEEKGKRRSSIMGSLGLFESNAPSKKGEDDSASGFSIQEQSPSKQTSRLFGLGKSKQKKPALDSNSINEENDSEADYGYDDPSVMPGRTDNESHDEPSLQSGDWNPQRPPAPLNENENGWATSDDPWNDRRRESSSSGSDSNEDDDDGTGYGDDDDDDDDDSEDDDDLYADENDEEGDDDERDSYGDSYGDSGSGNYEKDRFEDEQSGTNESETYRGEGEESTNFHASAAIGTDKFDEMVDRGDWSGIIKTEGVLNESAGFGGNGSGFGGEGSAFGGASPSTRSRSHSGHLSPRSAESNDSNDTQKKIYLKRVRELVSRVVPDEVDNVPAMMEQFAGREEELINTLQTMYERSSSSRARKAVHRSRGIPDESGRFTAGSADRTAAMTAASTVGQGFGDDISSAQRSRASSAQNSNAEQDSYAPSRQGSGGSRGQGDSYGQGSYSQDSYSEGYDDPRRSGDHDDNQGSYSQGSYNDGGEEGGSYTEGEGSYDDDREPSRSSRTEDYFKDEGEQDFDTSFGDKSYADDYDDDYDDDDYEKNEFADEY